MNDEIKEILDKAKEISGYGSDGKQHTRMFNQFEAKALLDYITNLQKENDILKRDIEAMKHNYNLLVRCIENGESMTQKFENGLTYQDYKSRCEKANWWLKEMLKQAKSDETKAIINGTLDLLLQGSDKDE